MADRRTTWRPQMRFDIPLDVDELPEFHAGRLLILMRLCGEGRNYLLHGRTKLAKLDFFARYPRFLEVAIRKISESDSSVPEYKAGVEGVEASMVRYRYGPWDHRYYNLIALLRARALIKISASSNSENYSLTNDGRRIAEELVADEAFEPVVERCKVIAEVFGGLNGTRLKEFVYETFVREVAELPQGTVIPSSLEPEGGS